MSTTVAYLFFLYRKQTNLASLHRFYWFTVCRVKTVSLSTPSFETVQQHRGTCDVITSSYYLQNCSQHRLSSYIQRVFFLHSGDHKSLCVFDSVKQCTYATTSSHSLSPTPLYLHLSPAALSFPPLLSVAPEYLISLNY